MTVKELVNKYISEGHKVTYRVRPDGGIIVTSVDGTKFTRAGTGNKYLRQVTGVNLSEARMTQVKYNVAKFIKLKEGQHKASSKGDSLDLKKLTKKAQRIWRKNATIGEGKVTIQKVRWLHKTYGEAVARDYLERRIRYSQGFAYEENVRFWADFIQKTYGEYDMRDYSDKLLMNIDLVTEKLLQDIHDVHYTKGISKKEKARRIKEKIREFFGSI